jgi:hypothetical protein
MERSARILVPVLILTSVVLLGIQPPALSATSNGQPDATPVATTSAAATVTAVSIPAAPVRAPALQAPAPTTPAVTKKIANPPPATTNVAAATTLATRTAYINAMYLAVVPADERTALAGKYVLGYNLAGLSCGTGCTGASGGQARSSFNATFFNESLAYQRNTLAHEAAHAYGFLYFDNYGVASWAGFSGWQGQFNTLDRGFVRTYDAEAWAACVAWKETGFNNRIDQIASVCTAPVAALAMAQIP